MSKNKYNPSKHPVLTKGPKNKGHHLKSIDSHMKKLRKMLLKK